MEVDTKNQLMLTTITNNHNKFLSVSDGQAGRAAILLARIAVPLKPITSMDPYTLNGGHAFTLQLGGCLVRLSAFLRFARSYVVCLEGVLPENAIAALTMKAKLLVSILTEKHFLITTLVVLMALVVLYLAAMNYQIVTPGDRR